MPRTNRQSDANGNDGVKQWLEDIHRFPLLSVQEERDLAEQLVAARAARGIPTNIEQAREQQRIAERGEFARQKLINCNLGLVISLAKLYAEDYHMFLDLIQEGNKGLLHAVEKWESSSGRFSTYSRYWIRQYVTRAGADLKRGYHVPVYLHEIYQKMRKLEAKLLLQLGREPSYEEIAAAYNALSTKRRDYATWEVMEIFVWEEELRSLDMPIEDEEHLTSLGNALPDQEAIVPGSDSHLDHKHLQEAFATLNERQQAVIALRFGLPPYQKTYGLEECARRLGISEERVRKLEARSLQLMLRSFTGEGVDDLPAAS